MSSSEIMCCHWLTAGHVSSSAAYSVYLSTNQMTVLSLLFSS